MNAADANKAIVSRFISQWPGLSSSVPYSTDNNTASSASRFAVRRINTTSSEQLSMGGVGLRKFQTEGSIDVLLVGPPDEGRGPLDVLAEHVKTIYAATRIAGAIWTEATSVFERRDHPEFPDSWVLVARTPFQYLETR